MPLKSFYIVSTKQEWGVTFVQRIGYMQSRTTRSRKTAASFNWYVYLLLERKVQHVAQGKGGEHIPPVDGRERLRRRGVSEVDDCVQ